MSTVPNPKTRRTTLTLPAQALDQAASLAEERHVGLSVVISEALAEGLRHQLQLRRAAELLEAHRVAFAGFNEEELLILDGIRMEPILPSIS